MRRLDIIFLSHILHRKDTIPTYTDAINTRKYVMKERSQLCLNMKINIPTTTRNINVTMSVNSITKSMKLNPAFVPIIMFGGSPIRVAVPPIFDAITSVI